jgi:hypothetical protein
MTLTADFNPTNPVPFSRMRYLLQESGGVQAGVVGASDFMVVQRGAGANMSVDVGAGGGWVAVTTGTRNGLPHCFNDAVANVTITAAHATLPRIDQIYLRYNDSNIPTGSGDVPTLAVGTGTATSGATLDNRTGALTLPADTLRLADVLVAAADTSITNSEIRDRRPWARGATRLTRGSNAGDFTTTSTSLVTLAAGVFDGRLECTGAPFYFALVGQGSHSVAGSAVQFALLQDAVIVGQWQVTCSSAGGAVPVNAVLPLTPTAGSHLFTWQWSAIGAGTVTLRNAGGLIPAVTYREDPRQNTFNNSVTSG